MTLWSRQRGQRPIVAFPQAGQGNCVDPRTGKEAPQEVQAIARTSLIGLGTSTPERRA